jgi:hypothetical protein
MFKVLVKSRGKSGKIRRRFSDIEVISIRVSRGNMMRKIKNEEVKRE